MRKKSLTIALVLLLLGALCAVEQVLVRNVTREAFTQTQAILAAIRANDLGEAQRITRELDQMWDKHAKKLEVLVDHNATDDVRYALSRLLAAMEGGDVAASLIYAGELEGGIEHVYERQSLALENVL